MGMVTTPEGFQMWVPDDLAPPQVVPPSNLGAPALNMAPPIQAPPEPIPPPPEPVPPPMPVNRPDYNAGVVNAPTDMQGVAKANKAYDKQQAAQQQQAAKQASFAASPEGKVQAAGEQAAQATEARGDIAQTQGNVEADELDAISKLKNDALDNSAKVTADLDAQIVAKQKATEDKRKQLDTLVQQEADYKVDDNRRWHNMGTGKTMLFWISTALSGLGDVLNRKSGPLMPLQMMQQAIHDDVDAQIRDHDMLGKRIGLAKNSIETYRQATGDLQEARKLKIAEEYERTAKQIDAISSKYASDKAKLKGADMSMQFRAAAQQLRGATAEGIIQRDVTREQLANQKRQTAIAGGHLALAGKQFEESKRQFNVTAQLQAAQLDQAAQKAAAEGNAKLADKIRSQAIPGQAMSYKDPETGELKVVEGQVLTNADGQPFLAPTEKEAIETRAKTEQTANVVRVMDRIRQIVKEGDVGKSDQWTSSPEYKELQGLMNQVVVMRKNGEQGFSSDNDMARIEKMLGVSDLTSLRSSLKALDAGREQTIATMNTKLKSQGYSGKPLTYADPTATAAEETAEDVRYREALQAPAGMNPIERYGSREAALTRDAGGLERFEKAKANTAKEIDALVSRATDPSSSQAVRDAALSRLAQGAQKGTSKEIKEAFANALQMAQMPRAPLEEAGGPRVH